MKSFQVLTIPCSASDEKDFFLCWVEWLRPRHGLTPTEQKVLAACLRHRHKLSKSITDPTVLEETFLNEANREKIRKELGMSSPQLTGVFASLRNARIIAPKKNKINGRAEYYKISPSFIPDLDGTGEYKVLLVFEYKKDATKGNSQKSK